MQWWKYYFYGMKNRFAEIILHLIFWLVTSWLLINSFSIQMRLLNIIDGKEVVNIVRNNGVVLQIVSCIAVSIILCYVTVWLLLWKNEISKQVVLLILLAFGIGIIAAYLVTILNFGPKHPPLPVAIALGIFIFYFSISIAYSNARLSHRNHHRQQQLMLDQKQSELTLLRNQLQPHFLFNALNNLLSMVKPAENPRLANSFERLSQLLRYVIDETQSDKVCIRKEISFLENYIELQKLRFNENEVIVQLKVEGPYLDQKIEPGLYITFVENAFKYGTEPEQICVIDIMFDLSKENNINFQIKNKVMMRNLNGNKTGIESTCRRLELIYPNKHELFIKQEDSFCVNLNIETQ